MREAQGKPIVQTLTEHLKDKRLLLLLDNCEHLLDGCARLADALVRQCPQVKIVASSREALGTGGEQAYRVPSLSLPDLEQAQTPKTLSPVRIGGALRRSRAAGPPGFPGQRRECFPARVHLPSAGRDSAGHRVGCGEGAVPFGRRDRPQAEPAFPPVDWRLADGAAAPANLRSLIGWSYDLLSDSEKLTLQRSLSRTAPIELVHYSKIAIGAAQSALRQRVPPVLQP